MRGALLVGGCLALLAVAGCAADGGVHVSGAAAQVTPPPVTQPLPSGTPPSADAVAVLRADPGVGEKVKATLVPCESGEYPVDARYPDLTGDGRAELLVTVLPCPRAGPTSQAADVPNHAGYVYDLGSDPPTRLFATEDADVELVANSKGLALVDIGYLASDEECCPTEKTYTVYRWDGARFVVTPR